MQEYANPARKVSLHEGLIVLVDLRQDMPLAHSIEVLILHALDYLTDNEVLVHKDEEEAFEEGVEAEEPVRRNRHKDLPNEFAEELSLVEDVFVELGQLLTHMDIGARL